MGFSNGIFSRIYNWVNDANAGIDITASRFDTEDNGFATGLSTCLLKDGTQTVTANIPFAGFRLTGVGAATATTDAAQAAQVQNNAYNLCTVGGTANAIILTTTPATAAYLTGRRLSFKATANSTGAVTINENALGALNLYLPDGATQVTTQIVNNERYEVIYDAALNSSAGGYTMSAFVGAIIAGQLPALTGDITTVAGTAATTLATVNSNVGSYTNASLTVNAKGLITAASNGSSAFLTVKQQAFTSGGTYTPSTGMLYCIMQGVGSGGSGAAGSSGGASNTQGGGGGGEYGSVICSAATVGASQSVTIGASVSGGTSHGAGTNGNTTSVGSLLSCAGGSAGTTSVGGLGGTSAGAGTLKIPGGSGFSGDGNAAAAPGGNSFFGVGGLGAANSNAVGGNGLGYGGGGASGSGSGSGGNSSAGYVIITEYCSQ